MKDGVPVTAKWCSKCRTEKPVEGFWKNQSRCKECQQAWRRGVDPYASNYTSWKFALKKLGLTPEDYYRLYAQQKGVCAVCGKAEAERRLTVDHCHETGRIRGLLCRKCNMGIGLLGDDPTVVLAAHSYLTA